MTSITGNASEFITFSRTSNATVTDSDGKIKWAPHNLLLASEQFDSASWTKTSTTPSANAVAAPNGTTTADTLTASGANGTTLQSYTSLGVSYTFGIWLKRKTGTGNIQIAADSGTYTTVTITSDWALYTVTQTPAAGTISAGIRIVTSADAVEAWGASLYRSDLGGMKANTSAYPMYNPTTAKNLLGYSEDFSNAAWTVTSATKTATNTLGPSGLYNALTLTKTANSNYSLRQVLGSFNPANKTMTVSAWLRGTGTCILYADNQIDQDLTQSVTLSSAWTRYSVTGTFNSTSGTLTFGVRLPSGSATSVDVAQFQVSDSASLDTYVPNNGAAPTAAAYYGPRLDFDGATLAAKGLLVEEARTNLLLRSEEFDSASWATLNMLAFGSGSVANATTAPSGAATADLITPNTTNGSHRINTSSGPTVASSTAYTATLYVKPNGYTKVGLIENTVTAAYASFDCTGSGSVLASGAGGSGSIISVGNGWYRLSLTLTTQAAQTTYRLDANVLSPSYTTGTIGVAWIPDGTSGLYIYGAQLEAGSFATSYIPTGAATATRNPDVASVSTSQFPYGASEGSIVVNGTMLFSSTTAFQSFAYLDDQVQIFNNNASSRFRGDIYSGASLQKAFTYTAAGAPAANAIYKIGLGLKAADFAMTVNANTVATEATGSMPTVPSRLYIGVANTNANQLNGHIRQITYIPRRLTNAELQTRTA